MPYAKKPTVKKQISMNGLADRFGKRHIELDASGTLSSENQFRGRIVGSFDHDKTFQDKVKGQNSLLYGVLEKDIGENSKVSVGAYRIAQRNTPISTAYLYGKTEAVCRATAISVPIGIMGDSSKTVFCRI